MLAASFPVVAKPYGHLEVWQAKENKIIIDDGTVLREQLPDELFSININYRAFQRQLWDKSNMQMRPGIVDYLKPLGPAFYRYPGGLVANSYMWGGAVGPVAQRTDQLTVFKDPAQKAYFGLDEYLQFLDDTNGRFFYVLNIVGADSRRPLSQSQPAAVADNNAKLAKYVMARVDDQTRYYQLGNELDRGHYEWPAPKYIARAKATMDAVAKVDKDARFVAFMRDFTLKYKHDKSRAPSKPEDYLKEVMNGLPGVTDYSLHHYYDGVRKDGKSRTVTFWMRLLRNSIEHYRSIRGEDPSIWITEHGRQMSSNQPGRDLTKQYTSNLGAAISTADYLIMIAQVPQIKGAVWHGLNAGPWQLFDADVQYNDFRPRPIYYGLKVLRSMDLPKVLQTRTASANTSGNKCGYDIRSVAFTNEDNSALGLWAVNHSSKPQEVTVVYKPFSSKTVDVAQGYISGPDGVDADDLSLKFKEEIMSQSSKGSFSQQGRIKLVLPPSSVSTIRITAQSS